MGRGICSKRNFNAQPDGIVCDKCGYHARGDRCLTLHMRVSHKGEPTEKIEEAHTSCAVCGECFGRVRDLRCHIVAMKHF